MFFDASLQSFTCGANPVPDQHSVLFHFGLGIQVPQGQGEVGLLPIGMLRIPVGYNMSKELFEEIERSLEEIQPPSKLQVVGDPSQAAAQAKQAQDMEQAIRSGGQPPAAA